MWPLMRKRDHSIHLADDVQASFRIQISYFCADGTVSGNACIAQQAANALRCAMPVNIPIASYLTVLGEDSYSLGEFRFVASFDHVGD